MESDRSNSSQGEGLGAGDRDGEIVAAAQALRAGRLVLIPTETVYGLAGSAVDPLAVAAIFAAKGRPQFNPLISHVADLAAAEKIAVFSDMARRLAAAFWPGPLTLVLPSHPQSPVCDLARAGLDTVAVRVPHHPVALALARAFVVKPAVLLADEPTGSLDFATGETIMALMFALNRELGTTLVLVTHDPAIAARCQRRITIEAGRLASDEPLPLT